MKLCLLLDRLKASGIELTLGEGKTLLVDAPTDFDDPALLGELRDHKPEILKRLRHVNRDTVCEKCGTGETVEVPIHGGKSTRLDCARCGRFMRFGVWYGQTNSLEPATPKADGPGKISDPVVPWRRDVRQGKKEQVNT